MAKKEIVVELRIDDKGAVDRLGALIVETDKYAKELAELRREIKLNGEATKEQTQRVGELDARIKNGRSQIRELGNDLSGATAAGLRFRDKMADAAKAGLGAFGLNILTVSGAVAGLVSVIKGAVTTLADFDKALASVSALGGDYAANIDRIAEATKTAGIQFGFTAVESVQAVEALAKAGVAVEDILGGGLEGALTLAAAGTLDVATAAEAAAKAMVQFGLAGEDVTHIADLFANSANKALGEVSDITAALNQSGQVANQFGVSIEETVGTLTAFANAGLLGSDAGTSFRTMLIRLAKPTDDAAKLMEQLGIKAFDANGAFIGVEKLAGQLQSQLKGLTEEQRNSALATIFGTDAIRSASILYEGGADSIAKWTKEVGESGEAARIAREKTNNLAGDVDRLSASYDAAILSGGAFTQLLRDSVQGLTNDLNALGEAANLFELVASLGSSSFAALLNARAELDKGIKETQATAKAFFTDREAQTKKLTELEERRAQFVAAGNLKGAASFDEEIAAVKRLLETTKESATATIEAAKLEGAALESIAQKRTRLNEELVNAKKAREDIVATDTKSIAIQDALIKSLEAQIKALDGKTAAVKKLTKAQQEQSAVEQQVAALPGGKDVLSKPQQDLSVPDAEKVGEASKIFLDAQEALRIAQITGTETLNLELLALDEQFYEEKIIGQEEYNARKQALLDNDAEAQRQNTLLAISATGQFFGALSDLAEQGTAEYKALATAQALINTYLAATQALVRPPGDPTPPLIRILQSLAVIASGLASVKKIQGFAEGGKVKKNGRVTEAWGEPVNRSNGDTVLATLKPNEAVLNEDQQHRARRIYGDDFFKRIGVPGFAIGGRVSRGSALVNFPSVPRPSAGEIANVEATAEARAFNFSPVVSVVEMNRVQDRVRVIQSLSTA